MSQLQKSIYYQREGRIYSRCSRCSTEYLAFGNPPMGAIEEQLDEIENGPGFAAARANALPSETNVALHPVLIGSHVSGVICAGCMLAVREHLNRIWNYYEGLPYVHATTGELGNTNCDGCGMPYGVCKIDRHETAEAAFICCGKCSHGGLP